MALWVVAVDNILIADVEADFFEKVEEPDLLLKGVKESHIFRLSAGESNCCLLLRRPGDCAAC